MNDYTLYADNRRPLEFSGELLGESSSHSDEEIFSSLRDQVTAISTGSNAPCADTIKLSLYKTKSGNVVLHTQRFGVTDVPHYGGFNGVQSSTDVYECLEDCIQSAQKKKGTFGYVTIALLNNVVSNHPDLEEHWVETID